MERTRDIGEIADFRLKMANAVRERGPMTVAAFMDVAQYDPELGYYARSARRSGRAGDFFTSVDVGPLFGELLEIQLAEMASILAPLFRLDLIEAGAGNGCLSADILRAARTRDPGLYDRLRLHLVEASAEARRAQPATLGDVAGSLASSSPAFPTSFEGLLVANELLDALPVHQVVMRDDGLREVYVDIADRNEGEFLTCEGPPSTPALADYLSRLGVALEPGWRVEINLRAVEWMHQAARRLRRGFMILIDYGHEASELYSAAHADGTLTCFRRHTTSRHAATRPSWLDCPGEQDLTTHVDFTSVRAAAEEEGLVPLGFMDQTYFLLGLLGRGQSFSPARDSHPLKTLVMPGGLGSSHKVLILGKDVGKPSLCGCSFGQRVT